MSEQIEWCVKHPPAVLSFMGTSYVAVARALEATFGKFPLQLERFAHEQVLAGMVAAAGEGSAPYVALLDGLRKYGEIEVRLT